MTLANIMKTTIIAALATMATALPSYPLDARSPGSELELLTPDNVEEYMIANNITVAETGTVNADDPLSKRQNTPAECEFARPGITYQYLRLVTATGSSCIGWRSTCGPGLWQDPHWTDVQQVVIQQIAKDGLLQTSRVGQWSASFIFPTSAYGNRDHTMFVVGMLRANTRGLSWYYSRDLEKMAINKNVGGC